MTKGVSAFIIVGGEVAGWEAMLTPAVSVGGFLFFAKNIKFVTNFNIFDVKIIKIGIEKLHFEV